MHSEFLVLSSGDWVGVFGFLNSWVTIAQTRNQNPESMNQVSAIQTGIRQHFGLEQILRMMVTNLYVDYFYEDHTLDMFYGPSFVFSLF